MAVYTVGARRFDDRRNASQVRRAEPGALDAVLEALYRFRCDDAALTRWILDGYPRLTEQDHVERFGVAYESRSRARPGARR